MLGGFPQAIAGNAGGTQLQCTTGVQCGYQQKAVIAFLLHLHVAAHQHEGQCLGRLVAPLHALGGLALQAVRIERQAQAALPGHLVQCRGQRACGDAPVDLPVLAGGCSRDLCGQCQGAAQAEAEHGGAHGVAQPVVAGGTRVDHGPLLKVS
ncbi:hypothetical protein D3C78_991370 [compost metagenome]